jgi:glycosyltransferase involved in cell wall biosynthesis
VRALIVTNMYPTPERPALGVFVRDQVEALKRLPDVEIEVFAFEPGAVLEALACDVPVLATPVGVAPEALSDIAGAYCAPFDLAAWQAALAPHLAQDDPRIEGRARAEQFSTERMAARVLEAWRALG